MYKVDRSIAIIKPKKPFADWANHLPDADREFYLAEFQKDPTAILLAEFDTPKEAKERISHVWEDIFEEELHGWCTNEDWWPQDRTKVMFYKWFDVEFYSEVLDIYDDPIIKEEY